MVQFIMLYVAISVLETYVSTEIPQEALERAPVGLVCFSAPMQQMGRLYSHYSLTKQNSKKCLF